MAADTTTAATTDVFLTPPDYQDDKAGDQLIFTDTQNRILTQIPHCTGPLSLLGSSLILWVILRQGSLLLRGRKKSSYHRLMLGLSTCDLLSSTGFACFGPWAVPRDILFVVGARASSTLPCDVAGLLLHMNVASMLYTAGLMIYFILLVRLEWQPETIAKRVEPAIHILAVVPTILSGVYAVTQGYYNPSIRLPGICWLNALPPDCEEDNLPCDRGDGAEAFKTIVLGGSTFGCLTMVLVAMVLLYTKVRAMEKRMARYLASGQHASASRSHQTALRGLAYVGAFFIAFVPAALFIFVPRDADRAVQFVFSALVAGFMPLQGLFNAIIYLWPQRAELCRQGHETLERLRSSFLPTGHDTSRPFSLSGVEERDSLQQQLRLSHVTVTTTAGAHLKPPYQEEQQQQQQQQVNASRQDKDDQDDDVVVVADAENEVCEKVSLGAQEGSVATASNTVDNGISGVFTSRETKGVGPPAMVNAAEEEECEPHKTNENESPPPHPTMKMQ